MIAPMSWLKSLVHIDQPVQEFEEDITMTGSKVESVKTLGEDLSFIVLGKIISVEKHPDSDHLLVAQVDVGEKKLQIVTGAANIYPGALVPVALDGGTITGGRKIKSGELRGVLSEGMMCSVEELGHTRQEYPEAPENGIYIFPQEEAQKWPPGSDAKQALQLTDEVVEFEITSNRADCFSMIGIARETAATYDKQLLRHEIHLKEEAEGDISRMIAVEIQNPDLCPRYIARVVKNVTIGPSPLWMRQRLMASGLRPINNIVDITNYVMLELGQPMHAFDIGNIAERKIIIRNARENEVFTTLDGVSRPLDTSMLVIADSQKAVAIAGVMGGENSMVTENASGILFESANFNGTNIRLTSKKLGLRTDASSRYEKGLDPNLAYEAVNRAVELVEELGLGQVVKGMADCYPNPRISWDITYSPERVNKLLGIVLTPEEMQKYLARVEIRSEAGDDVWVAHIPTFRSDLEIEADITEEVARLYGYNEIEGTLHAGAPTVGRKSRTQTLEELIVHIVTAHGYDEAMTYSFESPKVFDRLNIASNDSRRAAIRLQNPLGEDFSVLRTDTLGGILNSLAVNYSRRNENVMLFEIGKIYVPHALPLTELPSETKILTLGAYGTDFSHVKGDLEEIFYQLGIDCVFASDPTNKTFHPGRAARITFDGETLGFVGEIHPNVCKRHEIDTTVTAAQINLDLCFSRANLAKQYQPLPKFPAVTRDIALLVKEKVPVSHIENAIREKADVFLEELRLFDVYQGEQIEDGFKSVAYSIVFRAADRTLKEEEVTMRMKDILANLEQKVGAHLRES